MNAAQITAALAGLPETILIALQLVKVVGDKIGRPLPTASLKPLAVTMGVLAAVGYQLSQGLAPDITVAAAVGAGAGSAAIVLYDVLRGSFTPSELTGAAPLLQQVLDALQRIESRKVVTQPSVTTVVGAQKADGMETTTT